MARVRDIEVDEAPEALRPLYRRIEAEFGPFLSQVKVFAHRPPILEHLMGLVLDLSAEQAVPKRYLEIAVLAVSKLNECRYCVAHHAPRLAETGLPIETAMNILEPDCPGFDNVDRLVRDYAVQVTTDSKRVGDEMFNALRDHFDEAQIVELTVRTAMCGFYNRFNEALRLDIEDGVLEDVLAKGGRLEDLPPDELKEHAAE